MASATLPIFLCAQNSSEKRNAANLFFGFIGSQPASTHLGLSLRIALQPSPEAVPNVKDEPRL
jgi:hypothetical protein